MKVEQIFASQTALIQGMAHLALPDLILREEELIEALPRLAVTLGHGSAEFDMALPVEPFPLAEIYDAEIESLIFEVYRKDFLTFGFQSWDA